MNNEYQLAQLSTLIPLSRFLEQLLKARSFPKFVTDLRIRGCFFGVYFYHRIGVFRQPFSVSEKKNKSSSVLTLKETGHRQGISQPPAHMCVTRAPGKRPGIDKGRNEHKEWGSEERCSLAGQCIGGSVPGYHEIKV